MGMSQDQLIIDGLPNFDVIQLQEELEESNIVSEKVTPNQIEQEIGKSYEFLSATLLVLTITNIALNVLKIWWLRKKNEEAIPRIALTIKVVDGTLIQIDMKGQIRQIVFPDGTTIAVGTLQKEEKEEALKKIDSYSEIIKSVLEIIKGITNG